MTFELGDYCSAVIGDVLTSTVMGGYGSGKFRRSFKARRRRLHQLRAPRKTTMAAFTAPSGLGT